MVALIGACTSSAPEFHCLEDAECVLHGRKGACESTHYCSMPDPACPSGRRYVQFAEAAYASQCVTTPKSCGGAGDACCATPSPCQAGSLTCADGVCLPCFTALSARGHHTCALRRDRTVWCWGDNTFGQLGNGTYDAVISPARVVGPAGIAGPLQDVVEVAAGDYHTCARTSGGQVWCWGRNAMGQLGNGAVLDSSVPVTVVDAAGQPIAGTSRLGTGMWHSCAVRGGTALCWGRNHRGQLGDGTTVDRNRASPVLPMTGNSSAVLEIDAGGEHTCLVLDDGMAACFGGNDRGQLGNGTTTSRGAPAAVLGQGGKALGMIAQVTCGEAHTCVREHGGDVWCWGDGRSGQLGRPAQGDFDTVAGRVDTSTDEQDFGGLVGVVAAGSGTCARRGDGSVWCWGKTGLVQSGLPAIVEPSGSDTAALQVALGSLHACRLGIDGAVACWGANEAGQLGITAQVAAPLGSLVPLTCP